MNVTIQQAITAHQEGRLEEAEQLYRIILKVEPNHLDASNNLGALLFKLGRFDEAETSYKKAIELKSNFSEAHYNLGHTLKTLSKFDEAEASFRKAIEFEPSYGEAHFSLGNILKTLSKFDEAEKSYKKAIEFKPSYGEAHFNLSNTLFQLGKFDEAEKSYKKAIELKPGIDFLLGYLIHTKMHLCIWDDLSNDLDLLTKKINNKEKVISPFSLLSLVDEPSIHRKVAEINSNNIFSKLDIFPKILSYHNHKKIRIGYFSPDFRKHPVSYLTAELYEIHDRSKFEIHAFSFGPDTKDEIKIRIKAGVDYFHDVRTMSSRDIVKFARSLEIDIAVDLAGFTGRSRTNIFAMSAAPIQVNYLGYAGTMCANYMNYVIVDRIVVPENQKKNYL